MPSSVQNPADVVNLSLSRIGFKGRVGNLYDGSAQAKAALDVYGETRDEMIRAGNWGFAERNISMTLLKSAPPGGYFPPTTWNPTTYPPPPWLFSYGYPEDCLKVRAVKPVPLFVIDFDPQPQVFAVENDQSYTPPQKVILCNVPDAVLTYAARITDPTTWEANFIDALAAALGKRLAPTLTTMDAAKFEAADELTSTMTAKAEQG